MVTVQERFTGFSGVNALNTLSGVIGPGRTNKAKEWQVLVKYGAGTSAGVVSVETHNDPSDVTTGGWAPIGTIPWSAASKIEKLQFTGSEAAIRLRISTAIVGGNIDYAEISGMP